MSEIKLPNMELYAIKPSTNLSEHDLRVIQLGNAYKHECIWHGLIAINTGWKSQYGFACPYCDDIVRGIQNSIIFAERMKKEESKMSEIKLDDKEQKIFDEFKQWGKWGNEPKAQTLDDFYSTKIKCTGGTVLPMPGLSSNPTIQYNFTKTSDVLETDKIKELQVQVKELQDVLNNMLKDK